MNVKKLIAATAGVLLIYGNSAMAGTVGTMTTFSSGTAALASEVNANFTEHTTQINDNAAQITTMESLAASDHTAAVDCTSQTIAAVMAAQPKWGSLTLNISGTCNENLVLDSRSNVTLANAGSAVINGTDTATPTIDIVGQQRIKLIALTIRGGLIGVRAVSNSEVLLKKVTINNNASTVGPGLWLGKNSTGTLIANQDNTSGGVSTGTNTITGGTGSFGVGVVVIGSTLHIYDGTALINAGASGQSLHASSGGSVLVHDNWMVYSPTTTFTGDVELTRSNMNLDGFGNSSIVGNLHVSEHSSAVLNGSTSITGNVTLWAHSEMTVDGSGSISGTIMPELWSFFENIGFTAGTCTADGSSMCL
jgi:hypothetical protein